MVSIYSRTVTNPEGTFSGQLQSIASSPRIKAENKMLGSEPDFRYNYDDWIKGVSTYDLVLIRRHILDQTPLDGYDQIAADINESGLVSTYDLVQVQKLIIGVTEDFPNREQPWVFIPEVVTIDSYTGQVHDDFNGGVMTILLI